MHRLRLPALHIVALDLDMTDRLTKTGFYPAVACTGAHREQGDLVVKVDEAFHNHPAVAHAPTGQGVVPGLLHVGRRVDLALPLAGAAHHRLDDAGVADAGIDGRLQLGQRVAELVGTGGQTQRLGGQTADAFTVHG